MPKYSFLFVIGLALLASCGKNYSPVPGPYVNLQSALDSAQRKENKFTIDASTGGSFTTNSGAVYSFPANAFRTGSGGVVTGTVEIKTAEYFSKSDFLFSGLYPMSNGEMLVSAGEFSMVPQQDGQDLVMADSYSVTLPAPACIGGMAIYTGTENAPGNPLGKVNWTLVPDTFKNRVTYTPISVKFYTTGTKFVNGDRRAKPVFDTLNPSAGARQSFTLSLTSADGLGDDQDIKVFAFFDGLKCLWPMTNVKLGIVTENNISKMKVHFVAMGVRNGHMYAGVLAATPEDDRRYNLNMVKTTLTDLKNQVDALP